MLSRVFLTPLIIATIVMSTANALSKHDAGVPPTTSPLNIIVIGGSSGMGKAAAIACVKRGGKALIVSRSQEKLAKAAVEIQSHAPSKTSSNPGEVDMVVETAVIDATDEDAVKAFVADRLSSPKSPNENKICEWDGLVVSAAGKAPHGPLATLPTSSTRDLFESKFWSAYNCAKHIGPVLRSGGGVIFVAGVLNRRPGMNCAPLATTNGALEGLTRALALEWGPDLRVNCLSPGFCDTERFDHMDPQKKASMLANTAESLPLKRTGLPQDMGEAIYYLLTAQFCTGVVLDVDGGHGIRQYANPNSDPMRQHKQ